MAYGLIRALYPGTAAAAAAHVTIPRQGAVALEGAVALMDGDGRRARHAGFTGPPSPGG